LVSGNEELRVAISFMKNVESQFPNGEIFIVGGVPRDIITGHEVDDVDLATNIPFEDLVEAGFDMVNISKSDSQPVFKVNIEGQSLDLAQFRADSAGNVGRHSNVSTIVSTFMTDTNRRDITVNALGLSAAGVILDFQDGITDIEDGIIRTVGDPLERFEEDATRILRVARFAAKMEFDIDPDTFEAMVISRGLLLDSSLISPESISKEFFKAAKSGPTLRRFIEHLLGTGILRDILPELTSMEDMWHSTEFHPEARGNVLGHILECLSMSPSTNPVINLAVLFHDFGKAVTQEFKVEGELPSSFKGHEGAGVPIVQSVFDRLKFNELTAQDKKCILFAVDKHMLIHNLPNFNIKTLTKLINDPCWEVLKGVGLADEASRKGLFSQDEFNKKIEDAEGKVAKLGDADALRIKIKKNIDGKILMDWFPILKETPSMIGNILIPMQDFVLFKLNADQQITQEELKSMALYFLKNTG
jgi:poly(A) polymerase|tara:strand:+ start:1752 stop:3173 length:1422 start_codon:yes stop_codon:yes gene_type:complete